MNESQLIEKLQAAMDDATAGLRAPGDAAQRARARGRRRVATRGLLTAVPAVGIAAGLIIALTGPSAAPGPAAGAQRSPVETTAFVVRHAEAALGDVSDFIVESSVPGAPGQVATTTYLDPVTGTTRSVTPGGVTYWTTTRVVQDRDFWHTTEVDTAHRTWWVQNAHSSRLSTLAPNAPLVPSLDTSVAQIRQALSEGQFRVASRGQVNGHSAIELVYGGALRRKADALHYWVDAKTFRPVELAFPPFDAATSISESWIPRTPALTKQTNTPVVPVGFRRVAAPPSFS